MLMKRRYQRVTLCEGNFGPEVYLCCSWSWLIHFSRMFFCACRWDDDVVFKNQARTEPEVKKRFINDPTRNDFHKKFLEKYIW